MQKYDIFIDWILHNSVFPSNHLSKPSKIVCFQIFYLSIYNTFTLAELLSSKSVALDTLILMSLIFGDTVL